eukprot:GHVU01153811.1.p1 GENE.GHVU01153811.1~~GHVU01153811.1.p1  ORF type:complete len:235 (+),score=20.50 GHVU01153811.1:174-878(+)
MDYELTKARRNISDFNRFCEDPLSALTSSDRTEHHLMKSDDVFKDFFTRLMQSGFDDYMKKYPGATLTCKEISRLHNNPLTSELTKPIRTMVHMMHDERYVRHTDGTERAIQALVSAFRSIVNFPGVSTADAALTTKFEEMRTEYRTELRKIVEDLSIRFHDKNDTISEISDRSQGYASAVQSEIEEPLKSKAKLVEDAINKGEDSATILQQLSLQDNLGGRFCLSKCLEIIRV